MKALTVCQPYAALIASGRKLVENRKWPTSYRGPLAIHAGKSRDWLELDKTGLSDTYGIPLADMAFGAIIAIVDLQDCLSINAIKSGRANLFPWLKDHEHTEGPVCWVLTNVRRLETPIPYRGAQGLFNVPDDLLTQARKATMIRKTKASKAESNGAEQAEVETVETVAEAAPETGAVEAAPEVAAESEPEATSETPPAETTESPAEPTLKEGITLEDVKAENHRLEQLLDQIADLEIYCENAERKYQSAKKRASEYKKDYDSSVNILRKKIKERQEHLPLFDKPKPAEPTAEATPAAELEPSTAWRDVAISEVGLSEKFVVKLTNNDPALASQGTLFDWLQGGGVLRDILTSTQYQKVQGVFVAFWQMHTDLVPPDDVRILLTRDLPEVSPGETSTTLPSGIAAHDPDVEQPATLTLPERREVEEPAAV